MAAAAPLQSLKDEASCPICLDFYRDPVTTQCGHNFCRPCLAEYWGATGGTQGPCPQCRTECDQGGLRGNRQLLNMVELVQALPEGPQRPPEGPLCQEHREELKLFCGGCQTPICLVCSTSAKHRPHSGTLRPLQEAAQGHRKSLQTRLNELNTQLEVLQGWSNEQTLTASELEGKYIAEEDRIGEAYELLKQFLEERKQQALNILKAEKEKRVGPIRDKISELEGQQTSLRTLIIDIEEKCQQQDLEVLKDAKSLLSRSVPVNPVNSKDNPAELKRSMESFSSHYAFLEETIKNIKESFSSELRKLEWEHFRPFKDREESQKKIDTARSRGRRDWPKTERLTLDPDSAHPILVLSEEGKAVRRSDQEQNWPDNPKRFTVSRCVLGKEGFSSGRHYWELELRLGSCRFWAVGVALESVGRKEEVAESPEGGIWAIRQTDAELTALASPPSPLTPCQGPWKLGVFLDYEGGRLSLYNADTGEHLYTFTGAAFTGRLLPYFRFAQPPPLPIIYRSLLPLLKCETWLRLL